MDSDTLISNKRAEQFEHALAMLAAGIPLETILAEAGGDADWLRPMLETAELTAELKQAVVIPPPQASLQRMLAHSQTMAPPVKSTPKPNPIAALLGLLSRGLTPLATGFKGAALAASLLTAFLAGTIMGGGLSLAAQDSLPGQPLYGLKRTEETIRLNLTANPVSRERLLETFRLRRQMETTLLLHQGEQVMVVIEDKITAISGNIITVDGFATELTPETTITGELTVGAQVRLEAVTRPPDQLTALTITVTTPGPPTPTSSPTATGTPRPSPTPTATPSVPTATSQAADTLPAAGPDDDVGSNDNSGSDDNSGNDNSGNDNDDNPDDDRNDNSDDDDLDNDNDDDSNDNSDDDNENDNTNDNSDDDNSNDDDSDDVNDNSDDDSADNSNDDDSDDDSSNDNGDDDNDDLSDESNDDSDRNDDSGDDNSGSSSDDDDSGSGSDDSSDSDDNDDSSGSGGDDNSGSSSDSDDDQSSDDSNSGSSDDSDDSSGSDDSGGDDDDDDDDD